MYLLLQIGIAAVILLVLIALVRDIVTYWKNRNIRLIADFNATHPELEPGEIFITNTDDTDYHKVGWKTKRKGSVSYDIFGNEMGKSWSGSFPVFAQESELLAHGVDVEEMRNEKTLVDIKKQEVILDF